MPHALYVYMNVNFTFFYSDALNVLLGLIIETFRA